MFSKLSTTRTGFTLLELLIVLFILSLGYVSLFSSGMGQQDSETDDLQSTVSESLDAISYARRLAVATGSPIEVVLGTADIQLFNEDGSATPLPENSAKPYLVESDFSYKSSILELYTGESVSSFFFNERGRLVSRESDSADMQPLSTPLAMSIAGYDNSGKAAAYNDKIESAFLLINNVTGELMPL